MIDKIKQQAERTKIKDEVIRLSKWNKHLMIELPTGTGKGLFVAEAIRASSSRKKWLVLVPEIAQITNYIDDLYKFGNQDLLADKIEAIICYASLSKYEGENLNLHINEAHRVSELRTSIFRTIGFDQIISDSATIGPEVESRLNEIHPVYIYSKSLQECIDLGILPQPRFECIEVEMDIYQRREHEYICNTLQKYQGLYEERPERWIELKLLQAGMKRKRILSSFKTKRAKELIESLKGERLLCFCGSVAQAKELGGKQAIHSKNKNNAKVIEEFNNGVTDLLLACQMVQEGMNFNNLEKGIIVQLDGIDRIFLQRVGRFLRGEDPVIYILYIKNTRDHTYLKNVLSGLNSNFVTFH